MFARRFVAVALFLSFIAYLIIRLPLPQPGEPPRLYSNVCRDDLTRLMVREIEGATRSIHLLIYNLSSPELIRALEQKRYEGVDVVVVMGADEARRLKCKIDPAVTVVPRHADGLMHQKVLVIDRERVWIGSANWTPPSMRHHANLIIGAVAPNLGATIAESAISRIQEGPPPPLASRIFSVGGQHLEVWQLPTDREALDRLIGLIDGATESLRIALFTWTHPKLTDAVIKAHNRDVDVRVVIDGYAGMGSSRKTVERLESAGVPLRLSMGPELLHHKLVWIDEVALVAGSANWTRAAFEKNDDAFIVLYPLNGHQLGKLRSLWQAAWIEGERAPTYPPTTD